MCNSIPITHITGAKGSATPENPDRAVALTPAQMSLLLAPLGGTLAARSEDAISAKQSVLFTRHKGLH